MTELQWENKIHRTSSPRLYLLGAPHFKDGDQDIDLNAARPIALLAYLALTAAPQPRERLLDLLWTESTVRAGRKNLRNVLWILRKTFGDALVETNGDYVALSGHVWVDVHLFERTMAHRHSTQPSELCTAIDLYRGPLLNGVTPERTPEFDLWLMMERERLDQLYVQALTDLMEARQQAGDWSAVLALARRGLRQDPLQEPLYCAAMTAHAMRGERTEALRHYEMLCVVLERDLGIEPLPETQALYHAIRQGAWQPLRINCVHCQAEIQPPRHRHLEARGWPCERESIERVPCPEK